jgi:hypothetical protein
MMIRWAIIIAACFGLAFVIMNAVSPPPSSQRTGPDFTDANHTTNSIDVKAPARASTKSNDEESADPKTIDWRILRDLNLKTGKRSAELEALNNKMVAIPGFMVPFEDSMGEASEFLLVPSPQACIHVPPPPPNQMIFVKMIGKPAKMQWVPIWAIGKFHIQSNDSPYGQVSFYIEGKLTKPFGGGGN